MALAGGTVGNADLSDALICEALRISWEELQRTPSLVISYRLAIRSERARQRDAMTPIGGTHGRS